MPFGVAVRKWGHITTILEQGLYLRSTHQLPVKHINTNNDVFAILRKSTRGAFAPSDVIGKTVGKTHPVISSQIIVKTLLVHRTCLDIFGRIVCLTG